MDESELDNKLKVISVADHEQNSLVAAVQLPVGRFSDPPEFERPGGHVRRRMRKRRRDDLY
jgi:secreted Zn-dependent insulinase-like peptidase